jgi:uncharacterized protein YbcV (DUF1398 family)
MDTETSVIARKLRDFYVIENQKADDELIELTMTRSQVQKKTFKYYLSVALMAGAVALTEMSLVLIRWVQRLEE